MYNAPYAGIFHLDTNVKMNDESTRHAAFKQNASGPSFVNMPEGIDCGTSDTHLALRPEFSLTSNLEVFTCIELPLLYIICLTNPTKLLNNEVGSAGEMPGIHESPASGSTTVSARPTGPNTPSQARNQRTHNSYFNASSLKQSNQTQVQRQIQVLSNLYRHRGYSYPRPLISLVALATSKLRKALRDENKLTINAPITPTSMPVSYPASFHHSNSPLKTGSGTSPRRGSHSAVGRLDRRAATAQAN